MFERDTDKNPKYPEIIITHRVYSKLNAYANLCDQEISALGSVHYEDNKFIIDDIFLFKQQVTGTSTVLSSQEISTFIYELIKAGKDPSTLKFWWHSHVKMGVFWSSTDMGTINCFSSDWMISMVSNKQKEHKVRLDVHSPFRMYMDNLPVTIEYDKSFNSEAQREIKQKVKYEFLPPFFPAKEREFKPVSPRGAILPQNELPGKPVAAAANGVDDNYLEYDKLHMEYQKPTGKPGEIPNYKFIPAEAEKEHGWIYNLIFRPITAPIYKNREQEVGASGVIPMPAKPDNRGVAKKYGMIPDEFPKGDPLIDDNTLHLSDPIVQPTHKTVNDVIPKTNEPFDSRGFKTRVWETIVGRKIKVR